MLRQVELWHPTISEQMFGGPMSRFFVAQNTTTGEILKEDLAGDFPHLIKRTVSTAEGRGESQAAASPEETCRFWCRAGGATAPPRGRVWRVLKAGSAGGWAQKRNSKLKQTQKRKRQKVHQARWKARASPRILGKSYNVWFLQTGIQRSNIDLNDVKSRQHHVICLSCKKKSCLTIESLLSQVFSFACFLLQLSFALPGHRTHPLEVPSLSPSIDQLITQIWCSNYQLCQFWTTSIISVLRRPEWPEYLFLSVS